MSFIFKPSSGASVDLSPVNTALSAISAKQAEVEVSISGVSAACSQIYNQIKTPSAAPAITVLPLRVLAFMTPDTGE